MNYQDNFCRKSKCVYDHTEKFKFVFATDLHYDGSSNPVISEANSRIVCLLEDIKHTDPDFILLGGDLSQRGSAEKHDLSILKSMLDNLKLPYYLVAGNHDLAPHKEIAAQYPGKEDYHYGEINTSNFCSIFGLDGIRFSFSKGNIQFTGISLRNNDPDNNLDWLEQELNKNSLPKIVITHYGIFPPRESGSHLEQWGFSRINQCLSRLREIIEKPSLKVIAYLHGHDHINSVTKKNNIFHISGGGIQLGCTGYWLFKYRKGKLHGSFEHLSKKNLHNFSYHNLVNPGGCIDSSHATIEEYHKGNEKEQSFVIEI
jgi:DNA repair exonuclease SbcCD nuclease subunit